MTKKTQKKKDREVLNDRKSKCYGGGLHQNQRSTAKKKINVLQTSAILKKGEWEGRKKKKKN